MPSTEKEQFNSGLQADGNIMQPQNAANFAKPANISSSQESEGQAQSALNMLDELVATPMANANAVLGDLGTKFYDAINTCKNAVLWHGLIGAGVGVSSVIGFFVSYYRRLRDQEKTSHFFWFKRLLDSPGRSKILELLNKLKGENNFDTEILITAAHFYSPDISRFVSWKRRFFCWGKKRENLKCLQHMFKEGESKKAVLAQIFREISEITISILNQNAGSSIFECKTRDSTDKSEKAGHSIELAKSYKEKIFTKALLNEIELEKRPSLGAELLGAVGNASFIYWIAVFIFCLITLPPVWIVLVPAGTIFIPAVLIAVGFLIVNLGIIAYRRGKGTFDENNNSVDDSDQKEAILESKLIESYKREVFIEANGLEKINFTSSYIKKDLDKILAKRHDRFSKFHVRLNGLVEGCFLPFFAIWLFSDLFSVLTWFAISTTPAAPVLIGIAIITLLLGVGCGISSARKAADAQEARYEKLKEQIDYLKDKDIQVANLSLQAYDRLLRRYSREEPFWTRIKKTLKRTWVIIKRLGTGSLVFRLVLWGTITTCVGAFIPSALVAPIAIPLIVGFAVFFAASYYRAHNTESKLKQAEEVVDHLYYQQRLITEKKSLSVASERAMRVNLPDENIKQMPVAQMGCKPETLPPSYAELLQNPVFSPQDSKEVAVCCDGGGAAAVQDNSKHNGDVASGKKVVDKLSNNDRTLSTTEKGNRVVEKSSSPVGERLESLIYPSGRHPGLWQTHPSHNHIRLVNQQQPTPNEPPGVDICRPLRIRNG